MNNFTQLFAKHSLRDQWDDTCWQNKNHISWCLFLLKTFDHLPTTDIRCVSTMAHFRKESLLKVSVNPLHLQVTCLHDTLTFERNTPLSTSKVNSQVKTGSGQGLMCVFCFVRGHECVNWRLKFVLNCKLLTGSCFHGSSTSKVKCQLRVNRKISCGWKLAVEGRHFRKWFLASVFPRSSTASSISKVSQLRKWSHRGNTPIISYNIVTDWPISIPWITFLFQLSWKWVSVY